MEVITIGDELLCGSIVDTNSSLVADKLLDLGLEVSQMISIGDDARQIQRTLREVASRSQLAIVTGGLGPTGDDRTAQAAAQAFGRGLVLHEPSLEQIRKLFEQLGVEMTPNNERQAWIPERAEVIPNPQGTAPGFAIQEGACLLMFFPGVPRELERMLDDSGLPMAADRFLSSIHIASRSFKVFGLTEAKTDQMVRGLTEDIKGVSLASLPRFPELRLRITARAGNPEEAEDLLNKAEGLIRAKVGAWIYGTDDEELETVVNELLRKGTKTLAVAESCTGGLIAHRLTNVSGSSEILDRSFVVYSVLAKEELLGLSSELLTRHGAVSGATAKAMAAGAREKANTTLGLAVTGVAGPGGGDDRAPVGTVYIGLADASQSWSQRFAIRGSRWHTKNLAASIALDWLRRYLLGENPASYDAPWRKDRS